MKWKGQSDVLFYFPGDDNWWLGKFSFDKKLNWSLAGNTIGFGHGIYDGRPFWIGDFNGDGKSDVLFYFPGDDNWWLGTIPGFDNKLKWTYAGNTAGFGHDLDKHMVFWIDDFNGDGKSDVLFYFPGNDNWHLGTIGSDGKLAWSDAGNTKGFGHAINTAVIFWIGDFNGDGKDDVLFYYPGDDNWWLGTIGPDGKIAWALAGNTIGFGHAINTAVIFWIGDFNGDGKDDVLFYYPGDDNWWLGSYGTNNQINWSLAGNTKGFGNLNDGRPFWIGDFNGDGKDDVLFYYPGDDNWWLGSYGTNNQINWSLAGNTKGFGNLNDGRPFWIGSFSQIYRAEILFYYPGDDNWWRGYYQDSNKQFSWSLAGNTKGFGHAINDGRPFWIGNFSNWNSSAPKLHVYNPLPRRGRVSQKNELQPGESLYPGQELISLNGRYKVIYQTDGNLVLYVNGGAALWSSQTYGKPVGFCTMQGDGNLVIYGRDGKLVWATNTNQPNSRLIVQEDGTLVIRGPTNKRHWQMRIKGFADIHNHQFANLGFGGGGALHGEAFGEISLALPHCNAVHGAGGVGDLVDKVMSATYLSSIRAGHLVGGNPQFDGWPRWDSYTHQSVYEDWLERAWQGGLRLMVMFAVNNEFMCGLIAKASGRSCDDMENVNYQIKAAYQMQAYIDNKKGGPGKGWYRIVTTPDEAQSVINSGKLAVVLGIEVNHLFGHTALNESKVQSEIDKYYNMGIRHIFPIHFANNAFGGASYDKPLQLDSNSDDDRALAFFTKPYVLTTQDASGPPYNYRYKKGRMNVQGLTNLGKFLIKQLMNKGIIVDVDHTSYKSRSDILDIAESKNCPVVSGHTGFVEISNSFVDEEHSKRHEGNLLGKEVERIRSLGGMVAVIPHQGNLDQINTFIGVGTRVEHSCGKTSETLAQAYLYAVMWMKGGPVAFGTDLNGFAGNPGPRFGPESCPGNPDGPQGKGKGKSKYTNKVIYPFIADASGVWLDCSFVGQKAFDFNVDGLAHVGMLPDMIADFKNLGLTEADLSPLMYSAQGYIDVWRKVISKTPEPQSPNNSKFVSQSVSNTMEPGQTQSVSVNMQNTGTTTWKKSTLIRLGSQGPQDNANWGLNRVELPADVLPGAQITFHFNITAPTQDIGAGKSRFFEWKMVQEAIEWFGDTTPLTTISIAPKQGTTTTVPDIRELKWATAEKMILDAFLKPNFTGTKGADAWAYSQSPKAGTVLSTGTTVNVQLKTGPIP